MSNLKRKMSFKISKVIKKIQKKSKDNLSLDFNFKDAIFPIDYVKFSRNDRFEEKSKLAIQ